MKTRIIKMTIPFFWILFMLAGRSGGQDIFSLSRPYSPVVIKGGDLPDLLGQHTNQIKVYRYQSTTQEWEAVPFQIDERDAAGLSFFGAKNGLLDAVDEIVFMAQDAGDRASVSEWIDDGQSQNATRFEIRVTDPLNSGDAGWIYLYQSTALTLSPVKYIQYQSGADVVETPTFRIAHGANGFQDEIYIKTKAGGDSIDFLDRQKFRLKLLLHEIFTKEIMLKEEMDDDISIATGVNAHVSVQREGVRFNDNPVIRLHRELKLKGSFYVKIPLFGEFNIDTTFSFPMLYYPNYTELSTGEIEFKGSDMFSVREFRFSIDLNQDARGMTFYNPYNTAGLLINGTKDTPNTTLTWPGVNWYMAVSNPADALSKMKHGTLLTVADLAGDPIGNQQLYYLDWFFPDPDNDTGDYMSYGDTGFRVTGNDLAGKLDAAMASFYLPLNLNLVNAQTIADQYATPLTVQPVAQSVHRLAVTIDPPTAGIVVLTPEGDLIAAGSQVSLTALSHPGYEFSHWTGNLSGSENPATLSMDQDKSVIAHFVPRAYVIVQTDPSGTSFIVDGTRYYNFKQFVWNPGDTHVIETDSVRGINMGVRAVYEGWSNEAERRFVYQVPAANDTITGHFTIQHQLTTRISPVGGGQIQITPPGNGWYNKDETISLLAIPESGFDFTGWTGALQGAANPASLTMNLVYTVTANFGNAPPVVALSDTGFAEDDTLTLTRRSIWPWVSDATHPDSILELRLTGGKYLDVKMDSAAEKYYLFAKSENWNGIDTVGIEASDPLGGTGSGKLVVTVSPAPDPPGAFALSSPEDGGVYPDWPQDISFSWQPSIDPDIGDKVTYVFELDSTESFDSNGIIRYSNLSSEELTMPWPATYGNHDYYWRVWAVDEDSLVTRCTEPYRTLSLTTSVAERPAELPKTFLLDQNYPNPFNSETLIRFGLPRDSHVIVSVFNNSGQRVATLIDTEKPAGYHTVHWPGRDDRGLAVASGIYFIQLYTPGFTAVKKSIYLR